MKYLKGLSFYIVLFVVILFILALSQGTDNPVEMDYSDLIREIENNNVSEIILDGQEATVVLKKPYVTDRINRYVIYIPELNIFLS